MIKADRALLVLCATLQETIKLLLLGAGESGKSTIFKQMKILHGVISEEDKRLLTPIVYQNTVSSMKILITQAELRQLEHTIAAKDAYARVKNCEESSVIDLQLGAAIKELWADAGIQALWSLQSEFQIVASVKFYFNEIDRISQPGYVATPQDMLYARVRTTGIVTERYVIDGSTFEMYDVGGQRNERKKWIHCFDNVTAVIFVAALSEYDQVLFEDPSMNRISEALVLFGEMCNNKYFSDSSMILFLNKKDLFAEKVKHVSIASVEAFADYSGPAGSEEAGTKYFIDKFLAKKGHFKKEVYVHVTCATDTDNVNKVFSACKDIILRGSLQDSGYM
jgi:GTPase SAR1 family protein